MMNQRRKNKPHIVFLFSDTGGGHRSSSEAIIELLEEEYPDHFTMKMVDIFRDYAPAPFDLAPDMYRPMTRIPSIWEASFKFSDGLKQANFVSKLLWPYLKSSSERLIEDNPCDMFINVHPLSNVSILHALGDDRKVPYITIVTDLVTGHALWYRPEADLTIVPTDLARQRGIELGVPPDKIVTVGQPVAERYCHPQENKDSIKRRLGWPLDTPIILLVGGGEGMGPLQDTAEAIDEAGLEAVLVVIAGRNHHLQEKLEKQKWNLPVFIYGFVNEMPAFMNAADILVTKAGPGTISEAFIAGLPLILYSRVPGQEDGNVDYVVDNRAGVWAPEPEDMVARLSDWLDNPDHLKEASIASRRLAQPQATHRIVQLIVEQLKTSTPDKLEIA